MGLVDGCFLERCTDPHCFGFLKYNGVFKRNYFGLVSLRVSSSFHQTSQRFAFRGADVVVGRPRARSEHPDVATSRGAVPLPGGVNMQWGRLLIDAVDSCLLWYGYRSFVSYAKKCRIHEVMSSFSKKPSMIMR